MSETYGQHYKEKTSGPSSATSASYVYVPDKSPLISSEDRIKRIGTMVIKDGQQ